MQTLYIRVLEESKTKNILKKCISLYKKIFNIFEIKCIDNIVICNIPYMDVQNSKKMKKISSKICKKFFTDFQLKKYKKSKIYIPKFNNLYFINKVVLSNKLSKNVTLISEINKYNVDVLNGRWLFKYLIIDILQYISKNQKIPLEEKNVAVLVNNSDEINLNLIILLAQKVKRLSIITSNILKFKYIEEKLYSEYGIAIEVSNNKRKSLQKIDNIVNIDFNEEMLNKYKINRNAIIVNINDKINIYTKLFNGININYYNITYNDIDVFKENNMDKYFDLTVLYESYIYRKDNLFNILRQINKDNVKIIDLIGNNGKISYDEFTINSLDKFEKLS